MDAEAVAVEGDAAVVPALRGGRLEALAGLHHQLVVVAAGDTDIDVAQHDRAERLLQRLVRAAQPDPGSGQLLLQAERHRRVA